MTTLRIGIDTGGTFTDVVALDRGELSVFKVPSTPGDPAQAVLEGIARARGNAVVDAIHGTTVGLNAVLTGSLARTAFVTNRGFLDLIEIGRQDRLGLYDLEPRRAEVPVPRDLRFEVGLRRLADGSLESPCSPAELRDLRRRLAAAEVESIAIGLLHSPNHREDELRIAEALTDLGVPITTSAELLPRHGEFERFTATILNAAIAPRMGRYLARLDEDVRPGGLRLLRSSGGILPLDEAHRHPAKAMFSGPAGGVIATARLAAALGEPRLAALDMGGTSTDVSLVDAEPIAEGDDATIGGLPLPLPAFDVHTIGCGGGSIAWVDAGGALRVGPKSAGAEPGPACYGRSTEPTVTDAHVALGHLDADSLARSGMALDPDRSVRAIETLGRRLGLTPTQTALGVLEVAEVAMARALMVITSARSVDPARVPLCAYGGAGGLVAASLAARLRMPRALIPNHPGAFSAIGLALAGESFEEIHPLRRRLDPTGIRAVNRLAREFGTALRRRLGGPRPTAVRAEVRLRYLGQGRGLWLAVGSGLLERFTVLHRHRFGFARDGAAVECIELRVTLARPGPTLPPLAAPASGKPQGPRDPATAPLGRTLPTWERADLRIGDRVAGPARIVESTSVVLLPVGAIAERLPDALEITNDSAAVTESR
ncbi:MAG: hydantoinase/oxoprolinase family protein [Planctomycetota bacterium]